MPDDDDPGLGARRGRGRPGRRRAGCYEEFLSVPDLSGGLYVLEAGATDPQSPHGEDELYYVVSGRGRVTVGDATRDVVPGSMVFVAAHGPAPVPRHRRAAGAPRRLRPGRGLARLIAQRRSAAAATAQRSRQAPGRGPTSSCRKKTYASSPAARNGSIRAAHASSSASE